MDMELIEKYRHINVEHYDWWGDTYDHFTEDMSALGIAVDRMYFSGFWSQGDGACFEGTVSDVDRFVSYELGGWSNYPTLHKLYKLGGTISIHSTHSGRYYHSNSVFIVCDVEDFDNLVCTDESDFLEDVVETLNAALDAEFKVFEEDVTAALRSLMDDLYRRLEREYNQLTSDESVWDAIVSCGLEEVEEEEMDTA